MQVFVDNQLLTLFFCIGVGVAFGMIRFGPVSFGPAGALFAGLALSAANADVALDPVFSSIGLCVFCYMVGLAAGPSFVRAIRTSYQPLLVALTAIIAMAAGGLALGRALGVDTSYVAGAYAGAGTATPALGAVQQQLAAGGEVPPEPAVGYAVAYPFAVLITILGCIYLMNVGRRKPTAEDAERVPSLVVKTVEVTRPVSATVAELHSRFGTVVSRITRDQDTVVAHADTDVEPAWARVVADAEPGAEVVGVVDGIAVLHVGDRRLSDLGRPVGQVAVDDDPGCRGGDGHGAVVGGSGARPGQAGQGQERREGS